MKSILIISLILNVINIAFICDNQKQINKIRKDLNDFTLKAKKK